MADNQSTSRQDVVMVMCGHIDQGVDTYLHSCDKDRVDVYRMMEIWTKIWDPNSAVKLDPIFIAVFYRNREGEIFFLNQPKQLKELMELVEQIKPFWCPLPSQREESRR